MSEISITHLRGKIALRGNFGMKPLFASIPGGIWNPTHMSWVYPATPLIAKVMKEKGIYDDAIEDLSTTWNDEKNTGLARIMDDHPQPLIRKLDSWNHQLQAYHFGLWMPSLMLAMDMGTGKTKVAVDIIQNRKHEKILILCPKSVVGVWPREFDRHYDGEMMCAILNTGSTVKNLNEGKRVAALAQARKRPYAVIINHEACWRGDMGKWLLSEDWDCIIVDESHRAKDPGGKLSKYIMDIGPLAKQRICLTGTPMPHSPLDCFGQYRFLEAGLFGLNPHKFRQHFAVFEPMTIRDKKTDKSDVHKGGRTINRIVDVKNKEELNEVFQSIAFAVKSEDVLDLPPLSFQTLPLEMDSKSLESYNDLEDHFFSLVEGGEVTVNNALTKLIRTRQMASGYIVTDDEKMVDMCDHKLIALKEILEGIDEPIVVFCNFTWEVEKCLEIAEASGLRVGEVTGRRHDLTETSEFPPNLDFLAVNVKSGGTGIDLTRAALAIDFSPTFSLGDYDQSRKRVHRPGQTRPTRFIQFSTKNTVEPVVYAALIKRRNAIKAVLEMRANK